MSPSIDVPMADMPVAPSKGKARELDALALDALPWVEKYRPVTMDDVVSHGDILKTSERHTRQSQSVLLR